MTRPRTPGEGRRGRRVRCSYCAELRHGPLIGGMCAECQADRRDSEAQFDRLIEETIPDAAPALQCRYCRAAVTRLNDEGFCSQSCEYRYARDTHAEPWPYGESPLQRLLVDQDPNAVRRVTPQVPEPLQGQVRAWWNEPTPDLVEEHPLLDPDERPRVDHMVVFDAAADNADDTVVQRLCRRGHVMPDAWGTRCHICHPAGEDYERVRTEGRHEDFGHADHRPAPLFADYEQAEPEPNYRDDLVTCLVDNPQPSFEFEDIARVLASIPGEWGGEPYHWLLELKSGTYVYLAGWCDNYGWASLDTTVGAWHASSPYEAITEHEGADENVARQLMQQAFSGFVASVRERIGSSLIREAEGCHKVYQAMGFEMHHTWMCENCNFMGTDDTEARQHSEQKKMIVPPRGWVRRKRRDL